MELGLLTKLTPGETLLIIKPNSLLRDLMKYTFMDLLLGEKLQLMNYEAKPTQGRSRLGFAGIVTGKRFQEEEPKLHEMIFLFPFYRKPNKRIIVKHLLQMAMNAARSESHFKQRLLLDDVEMKPMFYKGFWQKIFGGIKISEEGIKAQEEIIRQFNILDKTLPELMKQEKEKASEILEKIKGNILLLNSFKFDMIHTIGNELISLEDELEH